MSVNLSIKGVPDELAERLRQRAARHHRSLQGELMALLEAALEAPNTGVPPVIAQGGSFRQAGKTIEQIAAEHLVRYPQPIDDGLRSVDIIRADRDSR
jgi:plasmid stability protein